MSEEVRSQIYEEIEDIAPEKAERYKRIAEEYREGQLMLPEEAVSVPTNIKETAECYGLDFEEENTREIAERTVLIYFLNEGVLTEKMSGEEVGGEPRSFVEHLQLNASEELQRIICKLYEEVHPHEWKDIEKDVKEALEIPRDSDFPENSEASATEEGLEG
ncbi:hypothetical protein [Haloferax sp. Q22]|uniref:hypothetical protein n=1 Tax=Haloferax sp. (strain Q22) TaxID=1526048 RepID=UPI000737B75E|nr:hypothetical protein [Haloferax sp. Q22]